MYRCNFWSSESSFSWWSTGAETIGADETGTGGLIVSGGLVGVAAITSETRVAAGEMGTSLAGGATGWGGTTSEADGASLWEANIPETEDETLADGISEAGTTGGTRGVDGVCDMSPKSGEILELSGVMACIKAKNKYDSENYP